ncbi:(2Fe-2S) ferredoxin domain-containing protein [Hoyosella rhizosphaerae]|uniref:(2Fe-2S) ferredoxin domain-containing protein n=1 Tax=Hoyosella rhizosphaerae TaxID=1755582 RepID=A0A916U7Y5_9ACTN|nr:(2Fe-2S) ferredoxin domain-containing protein [Hoyosella rhizosphaerae]MBN4927605.1 (2Fe-2S) ferredoxin domain-containing protein [Hoyosella rhizosphaerae]GGC63144.1 hypothetical protein GCM10011410_14470 [Hoyosella rhizosphaerae]
MHPYVILVARPTPSGVDLPSVERLARTVGARFALLDQGEPSIHTELDLAVAAEQVPLLVPLAVPRDRYLETWMARSVSHWRESRKSDLDVRVTHNIAGHTNLVDAIRDVIDTGGRPVTASARAFQSPAWSEIPQHNAQVLVCRGPRCTAYGAGEVMRALSETLAEDPVMVTPTGCLTPCNLGPLVVSHPGGRWHRNVTVDGVSAVAEYVRDCSNTA